MKRELFGNIKLQAYTSGTAIDRQGFLSALFSATISKGTKISLTVTHCDTETGTYTAAPEGTLMKGAAETELTAPASVDCQLDLLGCKQFVKITATLPGTDAAATYALALGDGPAAPVEE